MHYLLAGLIIPAMLTSCSSEDGVVETPIAPSDKDLPVVKLYANSGGSDTRTTVDRSGTVKWSQTDKISVNGQLSTKTELTDNGRLAIFDVSVTPPYAAVYPASLACGFRIGIFNIYIPSEQKHKDGNSFVDDVNISIAYSAKETKLDFKNVCGLLKATIRVINGVKLSKIEKVRFKASIPISGEATLDPKIGKVDFPGTEIERKKDYIDVVFDTPQEITGAEEIKVIWSLLPSNYAVWSIELHDVNGTVFKSQNVSGNPQINLLKSKIVSVTQAFG